jgi:undecaprenyl diphosphate synthase
MRLDEAYVHGAEKVYEIMRYVFCKTDIRELSIYALSYDNLMRQSEELDAIIQIQKGYFDDWADDPFFEERKIRVKFIGEMGVLPPAFRESCERLEKKTSENGDRVLNFLIAYIGHREISAAVEKVIKIACAAGKDAKIDVEKLIAENLDVKKPVDLVIRTAKARRLSGFLPWQTEYAEICVLDKLWPEVEMEDIGKAIADFNETKVNRGL